MIHKEALAPCGLYCGLCGVYQATMKDDQKLREKFAAAYGMPAEQLVCRGCLSDTVFFYCRECQIKKCAGDKGIEGCYRCDDFPCDKVEAFPIPEGKKNILRAVPEWRRLGTEEWVKAELKLFSCRACGSQLFRGAKKCRDCGTIRG